MMHCRYNYLRPIFRWLLAAALLVAGAAACSSRFFSYEGRTVSEFHRLALSDGGPHTAVWGTSDVLVKYNYIWDDEQLKLAGKVDFDRHIYNFVSIDHFRLNVFMLDHEGTVLDRRRVVSANVGYDVGPLPFERIYAAPSGTSAIAFQYDGRVGEGGGFGKDGERGGRVSWDFWQEPL